MGNEIIQVEENQKILKQQTKKEKGVADKILNILKQIIAMLFWFYVVSKLFVFDIDIWLANKYFPNYSWLLNYKFFILISIVAIIWLVTKNKHILLWTVYIIFYPIIILCWKLPFFVFKQKSWIFAFALINTFISFFKSIKYNFIAFAFFLTSFAVIFSFSNKKLLWSAILILFVILSIIYIRRFILVFKPSSIYQVYIKIFSSTKNYGSKQTTLFALDESIKKLSVTDLNEKQLEKWTTNLQTSVLFNRICLFAAKKLKNYQNSGLNIVSYIFTILLLIILTVFSFAVINFGLFKINNGFFGYPEIPNFFTFFYYSFNNLLFNSIKEITPLLPIAQIVSMVESFFALILIAIFISLLLSVRGQRHTEELNEVIKGIEVQGTEIEGFIKDEYKINSIEDAMAELEKLKAGLAKFIYKITESIK